MDCDRIRPLLADFLEHNLSEEQAEATRHHVRTCSACGRELDALGRVDLLLQEWRAPELPETIWKNLETLLPTPQSPPNTTPLRLAFAFSAGCVALLVTWALWVQPEMTRRFEGTPAPRISLPPPFEGTPPPPAAAELREEPIAPDLHGNTEQPAETREPATEEQDAREIAPHVVTPRPVPVIPGTPPEDTLRPVPDEE